MERSESSSSRNRERARDGISSNQFVLQNRKPSPRKVDSLSKASRDSACVTRHLPCLPPQENKQDCFSPGAKVNHCSITVCGQMDSLLSLLSGTVALSREWGRCVCMCLPRLGIGE